MSDPNVVVARNTDKAPVSDLYSQTVAFSHYNNLSAQLPIDPATGAIVAGGAAEQAEQCFKNLQAIVESIGHDMNDIIRVSIFLADIMDLNAVEKVQASFFPTYQPARTVAAVDALPQGALVFIEALVDNGEGTQSVPQAGDLVKLTNNTHAAPYDAGSTQTVAFSHYNNITMQLPLDPGTGRPILGDVAAQTAQCLANVKAILTSVDVPFDDIVKVTIFVKNLADSSVVDDVYKTFFPDSGIARAVNYLPARTVVPVKDLPYHCDVAVEAVVSHGDGTPPQAIEDRHGLIIEACNTDAAPKRPLATQSVAFSHYNNISAQLGVDAASGKLVAGGVAEQAEQLAVQQLPVPFQRKALHDHRVARGVEGHHDQHQNRRIQEYIHQGGDDFLPALHTITTSSSLSVKWFITPMQMKISSISTSDIAAPRLGLYACLNCVSITSPISTVSGPPICLEI